MENIEIIKATINDHKNLQQISRETFAETFSSEHNNENMNKYMDKSFSAEKLGSELHNGDSEFYFAVLEGKVIGYLKLNSGQSQTEIKDEKALEIERIYVLQEYHGKKVGQLLYAKAIDTAMQMFADYVWLGVWEENPRAISFYKKNGFVEFDQHSFMFGDDKQTDIMMKKLL